MGTREHRVKVGIFGAGAIGGYLGVRLAGALDVVLIGRKPLADAAADGLRALADGVEAEAQVRVETSAEALRDVDLCLVCVKTAALEEAAQVLEAVLSPECLVVPLQNGLFAREILQEAGLTRSLAPGLVVFNVLWEGNLFRRATSGPIAVEGGDPRVAELGRAFRAAGESFVEAEDIRALQMGKLLLNLNNGLCALTGLPLRRFLESRSARRAFAAVIGEGLRVAQATGRPVAGFGRIDPRLVRRLLPLPNFLFFRIAAQMLTIDPEAKTSTLQDLERGRPTEVDALHGGIVRLAQAGGIKAPMNAWVVEQVKGRERGEIGAFDPDQLWRDLRSQR